MTALSDIHKIRYLGGPLDELDETMAAAELWRAIGFAACIWARMEQHIDAILIHLNQPRHSENLCDPDHPIGFRQKIKLLKRWFNQHPALAKHREAIRKITSDLLVLSKTRHMLLHSILDAYDPRTKTATFRSIKPKTQMTFTVYKHTGTVDNLVAFADRTRNVYLRLARISPQLFMPDAIELLRRP
jgi:hypothetical protein